MNDSYQIGIAAENKVVEIMQTLNFVVIAKRYHCGHSEIDLILVNHLEKIIVFCEVKFRNTINDYDNIINKKQLSRLYIAANYFIVTNQELYNDYNSRFDCFIFTNSLLNYLHIENISM